MTKGGVTSCSFLFVSFFYKEDPFVFCALGVDCSAVSREWFSFPNARKLSLFERVCVCVCVLNRMELVVHVCVRVRNV